MDISRELDRIIVAIELDHHGAFVVCLLRRWKAYLERRIP